ncbi:hypothetical protein ACFQE5_22300 [Pseudonocardia hispaniensis]|uniref:Uncharacterized protein n=1 Tax=Pseudonocardia hispaniensis TaxID=904933 RepID=A0ABW1J849_9PSEU
MAEFVRPTQAFVCVDTDGVKRRFDPTMLLLVGHWAIEGREDLFAPARDVDQVERERVTAVGPRPVEQATAAPGERRATRRPRRKTDEPDED